MNLGNPRNDHSIRHLARALADAYRELRPDQPPPRLETVTAEAFYGAGYDDSAVRIPSIAKATRLLAWRPRLDLEEMLPGILADYLARYEGRAAAPSVGSLMAACPIARRRASLSGSNCRPFIGTRASRDPNRRRKCCWSILIGPLATRPVAR